MKAQVYKPLFMKPRFQRSEKCKSSMGNCGKVEELISIRFLLLSEKAYAFTSTTFPAFFSFVVLRDMVSGHDG